MQDMTAHVDFTALARVGHKPVLRSPGSRIRWDFLIGLGAEAILDSLEPESAGFMLPFTCCGRTEWAERSRFWSNITGMATPNWTG